MSSSKLLLALDPNICIAAGCPETEHGASRALLRLIAKHKEQIALGVDAPRRALWRRYRELAKEEVSQGSPDMQLWWTWVLNLPSQDIVYVPHKASDWEFIPAGCAKDLELELLSIAVHDHRTKLLVTGKELDNNPKIVRRCVHDERFVEHIKLTNDRCKNMTVLSSFDAYEFIKDWCGGEHEYPATERELRHFLADNRATESDKLEFKWPLREDSRNGQGYSRSIIEAVAEAICEFANTHGGTVLLGIDEDEIARGIIRGFPSVFFHNDRDMVGVQQSEDEMLLKVAEVLGKCLDPVPHKAYVDMWPIPIDSNGRYVIVFDVKKAAFEVTYRRRKLYRFGPRKQYVIGVE